MANRSAGVLTNSPCCNRLLESWGPDQSMNPLRNGLPLFRCIACGNVFDEFGLWFLSEWMLRAKSCRRSCEPAATDQPPR